VRIAAEGFAPADDAFVLAPGSPRRVALRGDGPWRGGRVTALNLIGEALVSGPDVAA
jgi:hypothetical protein